MTQTSTPAVQTLTTPITGDDLRAADTRATDVRSPEGVLLAPAGKLTWAIHNTWDGDFDGFAEWINAETRPY
jgi:hypothetical protein